MHSFNRTALASYGSAVFTPFHHSTVNSDFQVFIFFTTKHRPAVWDSQLDSWSQCQLLARVDPENQHMIMDQELVHLLPKWVTCMESLAAAGIYRGNQYTWALFFCSVCLSSHFFSVSPIIFFQTKSSCYYGMCEYYQLNFSSSKVDWTWTWKQGPCVCLPTWFCFFLFFQSHFKFWMRLRQLNFSSSFKFFILALEFRYLFDLSIV